MICLVTLPTQPISFFENVNGYELLPDVVSSVMYWFQVQNNDTNLWLADSMACTIENIPLCALWWRKASYLPSVWGEIDYGLSQSPFINIVSCCFRKCFGSYFSYTNWFVFFLLFKWQSHEYRFMCCLFFFFCINYLHYVKVGHVVAWV